MDWEDIAYQFGKRERREYQEWAPSHPTAVIPHPLYSDSRYHYGKTQVLWGRKEKGLEWNYSDRLWQWDYDKAKKASEVASASGALQNTAGWHEAYLNAYFEKKTIELRCIIGGCNVATGYAYYVYGYVISVGNQEEED